MRILIWQILMVSPLAVVQAQDWSGGIRAGLNYSRLDGPPEMDGSGKALETHSLSSGFHIGAMVGRRLGNAVGLRAELLYTQRGTDYRYQGPSYFRFFSESGAAATTRGERLTTLRVTNTYLDLPLSAYLRLGRLELSAGGYGGFLVSSKAVGEMNYSGKSTLGQNLDPIVVSLQYNYLSDAYQQAGVPAARTITVDNRRVVVPSRIGAYYDARDTGIPLYRRTDAGIHAGLGWFMSQGLYLGARLQQGLLDMSQADQEYSLVSLDASGKIVPRSDKDRNFSVQLSIGFSL